MWSLFTSTSARSKASTMPARRRPAFHISKTGLLYFGMMLFMCAAAINSQANLLFGVLGLMVGILMISSAISRVILRKLQINRILPEHAVVGKTAAVTYEFTNRKRIWPSFSVLLAEIDAEESFMRQPHGYMLHAAPGMTATVSIEILPMRRGLYVLNRYQLSTSFPFGFIKRAINGAKKDSLLVYPALGKVNPRLLSLCRSAEKSGPRMRPRRGGIDEFYGLKEFRQGENPRWIYWRRSARTGTLVAKEMTQVAPPRILILVDTFIPDGSAEQHAGVEHTIAMAASLADEALSAGLSVGLCAWSDGWVSIPANRGKRHRRELLSALALLPLNQTEDSHALLDYTQKVQESGTTPVLITPHDVQVALSDHLRSGMIALSPASAQAAHYFEFDSSIDFNCCMPLSQQPSRNRD